MNQSSSIDIHSLNSNLIVTDRFNDEILKSYQSSVTLTSKIITTLKRYNHKYYIEVRKWKKDYFNGTSDMFPTKQGIIFQLNDLNQILEVLQDIKSINCNDKSI